MKTTKQIYSYCFFILALCYTQAAWAHFGSKGPFGGTVSCAISKDSLVYIGTLNGGVYISSNNGVTSWTARPVGLTSGKITALAHSGSYLFAATADSGVFIFNGFVGADRYWNKINNGLGSLRIRSLVALDSITVLAGTDGNGLYKTTNKGASWSRVNSVGINSAVITGLVKAGNRLLLLSQGAGVFMSDDNGDTWSSFNDANTLNIAATNEMSYNSANDVLMISNANGIFTLAAASTASVASYQAAQTGLPVNTTVRDITCTATDWYLATDKGVYTTSTGLISWISVNNGLVSTDATALVAAQNRLVLGIAKLGVFKAAGGIHNWSELNANFNNPVTRAMAAGGDSLVVVATEYGVYISKNLATTYVKSNTGLTDSTQVNDLIMAGPVVLAATTNGGVFSTTDTGTTWAAINTGLISLNIKKLFFAAQQIYAIDASGNIFRWALQPVSWTALQTGLPSGAQATALAFYGGKLFVATLGHGVYSRALNDGSWSAFNTGLTNLQVTAITTSANKVFAGTDGSGIFVSETGTAGWLATATPSVPHTAMIGLNGNKIQAMASYGGYVYAGYKGGLLTTSDNGTTWIAGGNQFNLPSFTDVTKIDFVRSRVFVSTENNAVYSNALSEIPVLRDTLVASQETLEFASGAGEGIFVSVTSNRGWTIAADQPWIILSASTGFRNNELMVSAAVNAGAPRSGLITLTAGTVIRNISVTQAGVTGLREEQLKNASFLVYPNPSNGAFTVDFSETGAAVQEIRIYDMQGNLLATNKVVTNAPSSLFHAGLSPGIYFLQADTDQGKISRKLVVQ